MHVGGSGCIVGVGGRVDLGLMVVGGIDMGVSKNRATPKWMVYNGKPY